MTCCRCPNFFEPRLWSNLTGSCLESGNMEKNLYIEPGRNKIMQQSPHFPIGHNDYHSWSKLMLRAFSLSQIWLRRVWGILIRIQWSAEDSWGWQLSQCLHHRLCVMSGGREDANNNLHGSQYYCHEEEGRHFKGTCVSTKELCPSSRSLIDIVPLIKHS